MAYTEKYVTDAGAGAATGADLANAWSWATMLTTLAAGERANYNGAIARTTSDVFTNAGTTAAPMSLRAVDGSGNPITPTRTAGGTLDMTGVGVITYTSTGKLTVPTFFVVDSISITALLAGSTLTTGASSVVKDSLVVNTHASSASAVAIAAAEGTTVDNCDATISSSSGSAYAITTAGGKVTRCRVNPQSSGSNGITSTGRGTIEFCTIINFATGINFSGTKCDIDSCSFRNGTGNYINNAIVGSVQNCVAWGSAGSSKWYNSTTSVRMHYQRNNAVGNMGAGDTNEGDWPVIGEVSLSADPFTSSSDLTLNSTAGGGAACKGVGLHPYLDIGAWQVQASAATGGAMVIGG